MKSPIVFGVKWIIAARKDLSPRSYESSWRTIFLLQAWRSGQLKGGKPERWKPQTASNEIHSAMFTSLKVHFTARKHSAP
jgi:hypothetical protein